MTRVALVLYVIMAIWLIVASGRRIALTLYDGAATDWSPYVSLTIGILAILALIAAWDEIRSRHQ